MARTTKGSGASGSAASTPAKTSSAPAARTRSSRAKPGTSTTTTKTARSTSAQATKRATGQPRKRTARSASAGPPAAPHVDPDAGKKTSADRTKPRIVSVADLGPFEKVAIVVMPLESAKTLCGDPSARIAPVLEGVYRDLLAFAELGEAGEALANSALGGTALALALELENPYNSATSKSMCAGQLRDTLDRLRELAPVKEEGDELDELAAERKRRRDGVAGAAAKRLP